jgi:hypothetical protein
MKQEILFSSSNSSSLKKAIESSFDSISFFDYGQIFFGGKIIICFVMFKTNENLKLEWKNFNNYFTAKCITNINDDYSKWNSYVFYLSQDDISKSLKYEIENHKFSTRKIVIEMENPVINDRVINNIISEHIVNDDIKFDIQSTGVGEFSKNELISNILDNLIKDNSKKADDTTLTELLTKIETGLDNEN